MTLENINLQKKEQTLKNEAFRRAANKKRGGIGFGDADSPVVLEEATVKGRDVNVETQGGDKTINGKARILSVGGNVVVIPLENGENGPIISVDDAGKVFSDETQIKVKKAIARSRKKRKETIGAR